MCVRVCGGWVRVLEGGGGVRGRKGDMHAKVCVHCFVT